MFIHGLMVGLFVGGIPWVALGIYIGVKAMGGECGIDVEDEGDE